MGLLGKHSEYETLQIGWVPCLWEKRSRIRLPGWEWARETGREEEGQSRRGEEGSASYEPFLTTPQSLGKLLKLTCSGRDSCVCVCKPAKDPLMSGPHWVQQCLCAWSRGPRRRDPNNQSPWDSQKSWQSSGLSQARDSNQICQVFHGA